MYVHFLITSIFKSLYFLKWCPIFDTSPLTQFSKFNNFLWVCWFLGKNISNFVPSAWKLDKPYYHNYRPIRWFVNLRKKPAVYAPNSCQIVTPDVFATFFDLVFYFDLPPTQGAPQDFGAKIQTIAIQILRETEGFQFRKYRK